MMRRAFLLLIAVQLPRTGAAQQALLPDSAASPVIRELAVAISRGEGGAVGAFWQEIEKRGTPLLEEDTAHTGHTLATFLYRAAEPGLEVELESNISALDQEAAATSVATIPLRNLRNSDVRYVTFRLRNDIRAPYRFRLRAPGAEPRSVTDPLNPTVWEPEQPALRASVVELPGAPPQPWRAAGREAGDWDELVLVDASNAKRTVYVYRPVGWQVDASTPYPALVGLGAFGTGIGMRVDWMADYLLAAGRIRPMVFLLVDLRQDDEASRYETIDAFVTDVVLPHAREHYRVSDRPQDIAVSGTSRRGMVASMMAFRRPDVFGRVISLSGSYYWKPAEESEPVWAASQFATAEARPVRFYLAAGELETFVNRGNRGHYLVGANRHFRDVLRARGYDVLYREFNGVHSDLNWQDWLANGLAYFFASSAR